MTNPTASDVINLMPTELGVSIYVEIIIIDKSVRAAGIEFNTACGRDCNYAIGFSIYRDLYTPTYATTVKAALNVKGKSGTNYTPYYRDFNTNSLTLASYSDAVVNRRSLVFVHNDLSNSDLAFAMAHIGSHREILPSRMPK